MYFEKKNKDRKTRRSRCEQKVVGFSSAPILRKETGGSYQGEIQRVIDHPTWRRTQGAGIVKGWDGKRDRVCIPDTFT